MHALIELCLVMPVLLPPHMHPSLPTTHQQAVSQLTVPVQMCNRMLEEVEGVPPQHSAVRAHWQVLARWTTYSFINCVGEDAVWVKWAGMHAVYVVQDVRTSTARSTYQCTIYPFVDGYSAADMCYTCR